MEPIHPKGFFHYKIKSNFENYQQITNIKGIIVKDNMQKYPTYKPSNIDWIGEIPSHWKVKKLKYFAQIMNGKDYQEFVLEEGGFPVYGTGGPFARCSKFLHDKPSVLLGRKGSVSNPQFVTEPFWTSDTTYYTDIKDDVEPIFLYHLVKQIQFDLYIYGSAIPSMTKSVYDDMLFPCPPLSEQQAIVAYLDEKTTLIDELIAKKERKIELLKEQRAALINQAVSKGLNAEVALKDSGIEWIGEIPEHWEAVNLRHYYKKIGSGVTPKGGSENYPDEGVKFIRSQNVHFDGLRLDDVVFISEATYIQMQNSKVEKYDVLLNITGGSIGRCCIVETDEALNVNQHVCIIRPKSKLHPYFLNYLLKSSLGQEQVDFYTTGGNREGLSFESIKNFILPLPSLSEQQAIVAYLDEQTALIDKSIELESQKISTLKEYRQSLISNVVTGKIKVTD